MKNNIRHKGNIKNTSVIIFLKSQKLLAMLLCLGEPPVTVLGCCCSSFLIFILLLFFICRYSSFLLLLLHSRFLFDVIPHPSVDYRQGFYIPFYTFSPAHPSQSDSRHFHFLTIRCLLGANYRLEWAFFTHRCFLPYLCSFTNILTCVYQGFPGSQQFFLQVFTRLFSFTVSRPICFFDS